MRSTAPPRARSAALGAALVAVLLLLAGCAGGADDDSGGDGAGDAQDPAGMAGPASDTPTSDAAPSDAPDGGRDATMARLREGGLVVYVRHASTEPFTEDPETLDLDDPTTQRNLSEEGRAEATALGEAFRAFDVPVGDVVVSPYHRARETAELAFPDHDLAVRDDLLYPEHPDADVPALVAAARRYLSTPPAAGTNTVVVAHGGNLEGAAGTRIEEGAAAVFVPGSPPTLLEVIPAADWATLAASDG